MALQPGQGFGWSLALRGRAPEEFSRELAGLRRQIDELADAHFPASEGYVITRVGDPGGLGELRIAIARGDFQAEVEFDCTCTSGQVDTGRVRVCGRSESRALERARRLGLAIIDALRWTTGSIGVLGLATMLALLLSIPPRFAVETLFVLAGLLMVVVAILTLVVTVSIGAWIGERIAASLHLRARLQVDADGGLRQDLQRFRALSRVLLAKREILAGDLRRQPFRHEREFWALPAASLGVG